MALFSSGSTNGSSSQALSGDSPLHLTSIGAPMAGGPAHTSATSERRVETVRTIHTIGDPSADSLSSTPADLPADPDTEDATRGVYDVTKKTDFWFEREVGALEKEAVESATLWAEKGLPRHDVPRTEPFEPEQVLAKRCSQIFRDWQLRVRTKMQDAIERGSQDLGDHVAALRTNVARFDTLGQELDEREGKIEKIRREIEATAPAPVRYSAFVPGWVFWSCAVLLVGVEFFANFPIFRLLLPVDAALDKAAAAAAASANTNSWFAGIEIFGRSLFWNVEAGLVAAVAVIVLVVLGKQVGKSLRPLVTLRQADYPLASQTIRSHQRQFATSFAISLFGILCVLGFMFFTRGHIAATAASRVTQDSLAVVVAQKSADDAQNAGDRNAQGVALTQVQDKQDAMDRHRDAAAFAKTVELSNFPILLLNLGLIATAAMLGFGNAHADLGDKRGEHPDLVKLRDRCAELRREMVSTEADARTAIGRGRAAIGYVQHLLRAHPLHGWESKMRRLEGVVPLFRGENARRRGLDPANIRAFDEPATIELPPFDEVVAFSEPDEFARLTTELGELTRRLAALSNRSAPLRPDLTPVAA